MAKRRLKVTLCAGTIHVHGRPDLWAFGYGTIAALLGVSERQARRIVRAGLDPRDLAAVCEAWRERRERGRPVQPPARRSHAGEPYAS